MKDTIVYKFMSEHKRFFRDSRIYRGLYLRISCTEFFILEEKEWKNNRKTFVFEFDCGYLVSCNTELNTMEKYLIDISKFDFAEYITF